MFILSGVFFNNTCNSCLVYLYKPVVFRILLGIIKYNLLVYCNRLWSRVVTTRNSQDRNRPSSRLDSEGEEEEDDTDKVITKYLI